MKLDYILANLTEALQLIQRINEVNPEHYTNVKPIVRQIAKVKAAIRKEESS